MKKIKLFLQNLKWRIKIYFWLLPRRLKGYINRDGSPRKCHKCGCRNVERYNTFRDDQGFIEEYWVRCAKCKEHLGIWSCGGWDI